MDVYSIVQRWTARPIAQVKAASAAEALASAVASDVSLLYADLRETSLAGLDLGLADLRGADLTGALVAGSLLAGADLRTARLTGCTFRGAVLRGADLRHADARDADFRQADLRGSLLTGADLRGAVFQGANLKGACLDWRYSALPLEVLRQHPGAAREGSKAVAALAFANDERPFLWLRDLLVSGLAAEWILGVFAEYIRPADNAPALLRRLAADAPSPRSGVPLLWTVVRSA